MMGERRRMAHRDWSGDTHLLGCRCVMHLHVCDRDKMFKIDDLNLFLKNSMQ